MSSSGGADGGRKGKDPTVFALARASRCYGCDARLEIDQIITLKDRADEKEVFCRVCSKIDDLVVLKPGNAQITRLAKKYSKRHFVIVKWSELWKTYERQGLLVEPGALERARKEVLQDKET